MSGWKGYYWLADRSSGHTKLITLFESAEALRASEQQADELRRQAAESAGEKITGVERYEVALSEQLAVR